MRLARSISGLMVLLVATGCGDSSFNFSQYPGFEEWYAARPPVTTPPPEDDKALLKRFKPRIYLPGGHEGPIDFYRDYIAKGQLIDSDGAVLSTDVDQGLLNEIKADPSIVFTHQPDGEAPMPTIYGRVDRETVDWPGCSEPLTLTFLTYHLVFRSSGLPAGVPAWQAWPLLLIADLEDWHQLDHYTAVTLTLPPSRQAAPRPIAATFQQHNYQRSYLLGDVRKPGHLPWPSDDRIGVDVANRSNELYPHRPGRTARRAMSFMDPAGARYMIADGPAPWLAADDITDPATDIDPTLTFLPPNDAFYIFQGWLGERRRLPGRDGPPGADYNTLPPMKPWVNQLALSYWHEGDLAWLSLYETLFRDGWPKAIDPKPFLERIAVEVDLDC